MDKSILEIQDEIKEALDPSVSSHAIYPFAFYIYDFNKNIHNLSNEKFSFYQTDNGFIKLNDVIHIDKNPNQILNIKFLKKDNENSVVIHCGPNKGISNLELSIDHPSNVHVVASYNGFNRDLSLTTSQYITNNLEQLKVEFQNKLNEDKSTIFNIIEILKLINIKEIDIHTFFNKNTLYTYDEIYNTILNNNDMFTLIHDLNFESNLNALKKNNKNTLLNKF